MLASCLRATAIILARWRDAALGTTQSTNMTQLQTLLPQLLLTRLAGLLTSSNWRPLKNLLIRLAIRRFDINMAEAETSYIEAYPNFNSFFTRALAAGVRPLSADAVVAPADGELCAGALISGGSYLQAKGHSYALADILAGDDDYCHALQGGSYFTIYLSPRDYHRVHMACAGELVLERHVPGRLFSVNKASGASVRRLFARNERHVSIFRNERGYFAQVLVGAMIVGGISCVWREQPLAHARAVSSVDHSQKPIALAKGAEMGRFFMGSTVIVISSFALEGLDFDSRYVRVGQSLA